jgi:hypothetical protein
METLPVERGTYIRMVKTSRSANPKAESGDPATFVAGDSNQGVSLPVQYFLEGFVFAAPEIGKQFRVLRTKRNNIAALGVTDTSPVVGVAHNSEKLILETQNSFYEITHVAPPENYRWSDLEPVFGDG